MVRSKSGNFTPEVTFRYRPETGMPEGVFTGIVAEQLSNDPAVLTDMLGRAERVDYSQLEIM